MFEQVTPQYIRFIKQYICQRLFTKYIRPPGKNLRNENRPDRCNIGFSRDEANELTSPEIWHDIFKEEHVVLNYYAQLLSNYTDEQQANSNNTLQVYEQETFQEYIDRRVNINTIGTHDYQQFTNNMRDERFHRNMIKKYEAEQFLRKVKNHLIYIIKLYIIKSNNPDVYMTEDEAGEVDTCLDMSSYFKYMRSNNWMDHTQCYSESENNKVEADALKKIYETIYS